MDQGLYLVLVTVWITASAFFAFALTKPYFWLVSNYFRHWFVGASLRDNAVVFLAMVFALASMVTWVAFLHIKVV